MFSVSGLSFSKNGKTILDDIDLGIESGGLCALVGRSGSGKSVLLSALSGKLPGCAGVFAVEGNEVSGKYLRKNVLCFPGSITVNGADMVRNIVVSARLPYKRLLAPLSPLDWQIADEYIEILGLEPFQNLPAESLPDALFKKTLLAFSFAREARLLLLDNPAESLDPAGLFDFERAAKRYSSKGMSVVFTTHDLNLASRISDRIIVMDGGSVVSTGGAEILSEDLILACFGTEAVVSKSVYNGKPEISYVPRS
jgi:iron complex transport system ATP-binding protein